MATSAADVIVYKFNNVVGIKCTVLNEYMKCKLTFLSFQSHISSSFLFKIHRLGDQKTEVTGEPVTTAFHLRTKLEPLSDKTTELLTQVTVSLDFGRASEAESPAAAIAPADSDSVTAELPSAPAPAPAPTPVPVAAPVEPLPEI